MFCDFKIISGVTSRSYLGGKEVIAGVRSLTKRSTADDIIGKHPSEFLVFRF